MPENELPAFITETPEYDPDNLVHKALWIQAGRPTDPEWRPTVVSYLQEDGVTYLPAPPPEVITETPVYDAGNADHVRRWVLAGQPDLEAVDGDGHTWGPTINTVLRDGEYVTPPAPEPNPLAKAVETYEQAYRAAEKNIFQLMALVAGLMVNFAGFTMENVNEEGGDFVDFHQAPINAYKMSGRGPAKAQALYNAIKSTVPRPSDPEGQSSMARFAWLAQALPGGGTILGAFAAGLGVTP